MTHLTPDWFQRPATEVAPDLLGCTIVRQFGQFDSGDRFPGRISGCLSGRIVETEAYEPGDPACHAYRRRTERNAAMFAPGGHSYIYLIYGVYHCFNVVTDGEGVGSAVLIRALELEPHPRWAEIETPNPPKKPKPLQRLAAGPGKLCQILDLDRTWNGLPLEPKSGLWIEPRSILLQKAIETGTEPIVQTTRIGLSQGKEYPWRWYLARSPAVSKKA